MNGSKKSLTQVILAAVISGTVVSTLFGVLFAGYVTQVEEKVRSRQEWKESSVAELLGPINMQLDRTQRAFDRWNEKNLFIEVKII